MARIEANNRMWWIFSPRCFMTGSKIFPLRDEQKTGVSA